MGPSSRSSHWDLGAEHPRFQSVVHTKWHLHFAPRMKERAPLTACPCPGLPGASACTEADRTFLGAASSVLLLGFKRGTHGRWEGLLQLRGSSADGMKQAKGTRGTRTAPGSSLGTPQHQGGRLHPRGRAGLGAAWQHPPCSSPPLPRAVAVCSGAAPLPSLGGSRRARGI